MNHCHFCTLLCELPSGIGSSRSELVCSLRQKHIQLERDSLALLSGDEVVCERHSARVNGRVVSIKNAIAEASKQIVALGSKARMSDDGMGSSAVMITGNIHCVETSRAVLQLAAEVGGILDPLGSDSAMAQIIATQRSGNVTSSLSEVRFRSDCILIAGDDSVLDAMPRLPHVLSVASGKACGNFASTMDWNDHPRRVILMGTWSTKSLLAFRSQGFETIAVRMALSDLPRALMQWSQLATDQRSSTPSIASQWMEEAKYLTVVWSPASLQLSARDLWIEQLQRWTLVQNEHRRVAGLPLAGSYQSFQQVATWTIGFPGRMKLNKSVDGFVHADYRPDYYVRDSVDPLDSQCLVIRIDDVFDDREFVDKEFDLPKVHIWIAPYLPDGIDQGNAPKPTIFIPCAVPGTEVDAQYFRTDGVVVNQVTATGPFARASLSLMSSQKIIEAILRGTGASRQ